MKILLGFFIGMTAALLLVLLVFRNTNQVAADNNAVAYAAPSVVTAAPSPTDDSGAVSALTSGTDLGGMLPDVKKIYYNALGDPYRQVETEITDPDIARFFQRYMNDTGLDKVGLSN
jgi:hypothetical protein